MSSRRGKLLEVTMVARREYEGFLRIEPIEQCLHEAFDDVDDAARGIDSPRVTDQIGNLILVKYEVMPAGQIGKHLCRLLGRAQRQGRLTKQREIELVLQLVSHRRCQGGAP